MSLLPLPLEPRRANDWGMTLLIVFIAMLIVLAIAAILDMTPDTHREVGPHGDFKF